MSAARKNEMIEHALLVKKCKALMAERLKARQALRHAYGFVQQLIDDEPWTMREAERVQIEIREVLP